MKYASDMRRSFGFIRRACRALLLRDAYFPVPMAAALFVVWCLITFGQCLNVVVAWDGAPEWLLFAVALLGFDASFLYGATRALVRAVKVRRAGGRSKDVLHSVVLRPGADSPVLVRTAVWITPKGQWSRYETSTTDDPCEVHPGVWSEDMAAAAKQHRMTVDAVATGGAFIIVTDPS